MLEILLAAILIAFGILTIFFSVEAGVSDPKLMLILFLGVVSILAGSWIVVQKLTIWLILQKLAGLALTGIGLLLVIGFPESRDYQSKETGITGVLIGLIILIFGLYLLMF
ncbi:MAG: hypothetical protein V1900_04305 [Candidatus Aenigmatarchaeota archaeon]